MGRIMALDYGTKRTGVAVTDPFKIIASPLTTIASSDLRPWLKLYFEKEVVERIIIGLPFALDGTDTHATKPVRDMVRLLKKDFPHIPIETVDEQFTSKMAVQTLVASGLKKKERQNKKLIDQTAAAIMLQDYLQGLTQ
jgi:putative holliday junction resolvase